MNDFARDVRFAARGLARRPGFAAVAIATLGLGIGAATLIFSLAYSIVWQPLSYEDPERLVRLRPGGHFSKQALVWLREQTTSYDGIAAFLTRGYVTRGSDGADVVYGPQTTANFFDVLGAKTSLGRTFRSGEDLRGADPLVISHAFWQSRFGGDPDVLGQEMTVTGVRRRIIGVMPEAFDFRYGRAQVTVPLFMDRDEDDFEAFWHMRVTARLKAGVTVAQAQDELRRVVVRWRPLLDDFPEDWGEDFRVVPLREAVVGEVRPALMLLLGAVGLLLVVATVNVANLLFARMLARQQETSVRLSLGATPRQLRRQLLTESTVLSVAGGLIGLATATIGLRGVVALLPPETPRLAEVEVSYTVALFGFVLALAAGYAAGLLPAFQAARSTLAPHLARTTASRARRRLRSFLVAAETALAVILLIGAGLLVESLRNVLRVDPGLESEGLVAMRLGRERGSLGSIAEADVYFQRIEEALEAVPGVESAAFGLRIPFLESSWDDKIHRMEEPPDTAVTSYWRPVSPGYFETLGVRLLRGREFNSSDLPDGQQVAVLNETAARHLFPSGDPLGQRVQMPWEERADGFVVVGIAEDVKIDGLSQPSPLVLYRPFNQTLPVLEPMGAMWRHVFLRTTVDPQSLFLTLRKAVFEVNSNSPIGTYEPMAELIDDSVAEKHALTWMLALFAGAALALGAIGIYGVVAHSVSERRREMGIRLALGATGSRVWQSVVGDGLKLVGLGVVAGLLMASGLTRLVAGHVFGVSVLDPSIFAAVAGVLLLVAVLAAWQPARRAASVDPIEVLKQE